MVDAGGEGTQDTQVSFLTSTMGFHEDGVAAPMSHFREICARRNRGLPSQLPSETDPWNIHFSTQKSLDKQMMFCLSVQKERHMVNKCRVLVQCKVKIKVKPSHESSCCCDYETYLGQKHFSPHQIQTWCCEDWDIPCVLVYF